MREEIHDNGETEEELIFEYTFATDVNVKTLAYFNELQANQAGKRRGNCCHETQECLNKRSKLMVFICE